MYMVSFKDTYVLCGPSMMSQGKTTWKDTATEETFQVKDAWKDPSEAVKNHRCLSKGSFTDIIDGP